jgi:hypothetical protein
VTQRSSGCPWSQRNERSIDRDSQIRLNGPLRGGLGGVRARAGGGYTQYEGDRRVLHPEMKMAGRAVTMAFMPARADLDQVVMANAKEKGIPSLHNRYGFDMLQPGGVMVVDLYGMKEGGAIVGISPMLMPCLPASAPHLDHRRDAFGRRRSRSHRQCYDDVGRHVWQPARPGAETVFPKAAGGNQGQPKN